MMPRDFVTDHSALSRVIIRTESALAAARCAVEVSGAAELTQELCDAVEQTRAELITALGELCVSTGQQPAAFAVRVTEDLSQSLSRIPGAAPMQPPPVQSRGLQRMSAATSAGSEGDRPPRAGISVDTLATAVVTAEGAFFRRSTNVAGRTCSKVEWTIRELEW